MAEENTFNFENYTQDQAIDFGNEQALQGDAQIFNQNDAQIDPSAYFQEGNTVLKETAGIEGVTVDDNLFNQNNTYQDNTMDTNAIFGNTLKTGTEVPEYFGQGTTTTTTNVTNIDEGTNFFGETTQTQLKLRFLKLILILMPISQILMLIQTQYLNNPRQYKQQQRQQQLKQIHILIKLRKSSLNAAKPKFFQQPKPINLRLNL